MDDMKDKFKGFMKKVNTQMSSSSSGKFKGQGRVLGSSSSGPKNPNLTRPSQSVNPNSNQNPSSVQSKPLPQKNSPVSDPRPTSIDGQNGSNSNPDSKKDRPSKDGFDPFDSFITSGERNKNGYSLNVFECPICGSGFTSEEDVSIHIESCIVAKTSKNGDGVELDLDLDSDSVGMDGNENKADSTNKLGGCVGVYLSGNPSDSSVDVVMRLLRNIVKEPENPKFRKIRMGNPKIREAIGEVTGGIELLQEVGFELKEEGGEMWAVMDTPSEDRLLKIKETVNIMEQAKPDGSVSSAPIVKVDEKVEVEKKVKENEPKIIDREIKVFFSVSESVAARIVLPDSFYQLSSEEVRREAEMRKKKMADSQLLIPKSFKEKQAQAARKRYTRTIIRVQFPDGVVLQGVFSPKEPTSVLYEFVSSALKQQGLEFELIHPVPLKRRVIPCFPAPGERALTLEQEDLVPSALVKFKPIETDSMVFTGLTNELLEISEPLGSSSTS
ncbi:LOW QUALITY PROTEIN: plant UBX domain-containing protein 2-like [Chenopodium quinoa]|uniref:LOW QUALITY PROTEIN: plant UBX domain-containing protein 2-like n=1 Tax=Chenopodium quinoa TaxID=63459 RepID=UPI000B78B0D1|nr:LOW QUALITY PROTEIN: plant UBX domain-containing protein 2-like [Chenopodium quinoa]